MDVSGWFLASTAISVAPLEDFDATGAPTYGPLVVMPARIQAQQKWVTNPKTGAEVMSTHTIYVQSQVGIEDRIYFATDNDTDATIAKVPIIIASTNDETGTPVYWKIVL